MSELADLRSGFSVPADPRGACAVLVSGGLDSAVLLSQLDRRFRQVHPIYTSSGLSWEAEERRYLEQFLKLAELQHTAELVVLEMPVRDVYGPHWSLTGRSVPDASTADEAVYLPGRNLLLLLKAMLWCQLHGVGTLALGILKGNPFPDATQAFFDTFQSAVNRGLSSRVEIIRPFDTLDKAAVIQLGRRLPLQWTLSCIQPQQGLHCGRCNKCAERRRAFLRAGVPDPTRYA
jgi:7-cyano-7-deazaguanine synthase